MYEDYEWFENYESTIDQYYENLDWLEEPDEDFSLQDEEDDWWFDDIFED